MKRQRSTIDFKSNIYPTTAKSGLANDRAFLDSISDPQAIEILWHYNGSQGSKLNALQRRQLDKATHCYYADPGDYPWGTPVGGSRVVCLCSKTSCPRYRTVCSKFHPEGFVPEVANVTGDKSEGSDRGASSSEKKGIDDVERARLRRITFVSASTVVKRQQAESRIGYTGMAQSSKPSKAAAGRGSSVRYSRPWTPAEDALMRQYFQQYGTLLEKWPKRLKKRTTEEVIARARQLSLKLRPSYTNGGGSRNKQRGTSGGSSSRPMSKAEKKAHLEEMRNRPWDSKEDAILRLMYPLYGSDMREWSEKLQYRTKKAIEKRARQLRL